VLLIAYIRTLVDEVLYLSKTCLLIIYWAIEGIYYNSKFNI
jgi:hypothetical protein